MTLSGVGKNGQEVGREKMMEERALLWKLKLISISTATICPNCHSTFDLSSLKWNQTLLIAVSTAAVY